MGDEFTLESLIGYLLSPLAGARKHRLDGAFDIGKREFTFKAYLMNSKEKGHPVDMIRIDVKGE